MNRHLLDDFKAEGVEAGVGLGVVGEDAELGEAEVAEDLAADADVALVDGVGAGGDGIGAGEVGCVDVVAIAAMEGAVDFLEDATEVVANPFGPHVEQRAAAGVLNHLERLAELLAGGVGGFVEDIAQEIAAVNSHKDGLGD